MSFKKKKIKNQTYGQLIIHSKHDMSCYSILELLEAFTVIFCRIFGAKKPINKFSFSYFMKLLGLSLKYKNDQDDEKEVTSVDLWKCLDYQKIKDMLYYKIKSKFFAEKNFKTLFLTILFF